MLCQGERLWQKSGFLTAALRAGMTSMKVWLLGLVKDCSIPYKW